MEKRNEGFYRHKCIYHIDAKEFYSEIKNKGMRLLTTNLVICETLNYLRAKISLDVAVSFRENLYKSSIIEVINITPAIEEEAFRIFKQHNDKDFSFTDCISFSVMKAKKLDRVFAFDKHFEQFGNLKRLPEINPRLI